MLILFDSTEIYKNFNGNVNMEMIFKSLIHFKSNAINSTKYNRVKHIYQDFYCIYFNLSCNIEIYN